MDLLRALAGSRLRDPRKLGRDELRALWRLRLEQLQLKPGVDEDDDFESFIEDYQRPGLVWTLHRGDEIVGTYLQRVVRVEHAGRRLVVLAPDYVFMAAEVRGHFVLILAVIALTLLPLLRHPLRRAVATGAVYPPAYIAWRRQLPRCWSLADPTLEPAQRDLVEALGPILWPGAWHADGTVTYRTLPREVAPRSAEGRRIFADYQRWNPDWREGRSLFFVTPLELRTIWAGVSRAVGVRRGSARRERRARGSRLHS